MLIQVKDNSTLAKLLATEDIHVTYKNARTASFDVKTRELVIPIMKEMSKDIQDLMTLHEVGHALFTSLDMLQESIKRKLDHSFVNVIEDVRIEKAIQNKYRGSKSAFKRGYQDLIGMDFFETNGKDINKYNLIDRINLFYKHHENVKFSEDEKVWVKKVGDCVTEKDVLDVAEELHAYIKDNKESQGENEDNSSKMLAPDMDSGEDTAEQEGKMIYSGMQFSDDEGDTEESEEESTESSNSSESDGQEEETETTASSGGDEEAEESKVESSTDSIEGGQSDGDATIKSVTDQASRNSLDDLVDNNAEEKKFVNIPKINLKETIVDYKKVTEMLDKTYTPDTIGDCKTFYDVTLDDITKYEKDAKKVVSYMVKEFEMKKAADQYARASVSKTGSLDMGRLHTYKYNDDLFKKVTTLPGATSHGLVMFLDWSGSMQYNISGTMKQLFNLVWFCNRVKIPFEVYAFTDQMGGRYRKSDGVYVANKKVKTGDMKVEYVKLLNFMSSRMSKVELKKMTHQLFMLSESFAPYRDWQVKGYPKRPIKDLYLGGTPLNATIITAMDLLPKFKSETGVQKVNTIFLTDGASHDLSNFYTSTVNRDGDVVEGQGYFGTKKTVITDPISNTKVFYKEELGKRIYSWDIQTQLLLKLLKSRMPEMNIVGFFIAGEGRKGKIGQRTIQDKFGITKWNNPKEWKQVLETIRKDNVAVCTSQGYDEYYILPGSPAFEVETNLDEVNHHSTKAQLKRAFTKFASGKTLSRPVLNKFIAMVA